ncbi:alanine/ornithine racemase family PLP-dependent enzyme [Tetragenococcus muriaticus]|uniref:Ornithine racemase n=1 Tax=Tetragenococcus muriaticus 3MR10-3 TaxID=1302648 RepID=A0A091BYY2_9ENTE|nr:alanine/ornithine racemase family PLP-dependent enzyme [Tetragenococcus muriaticus]KFN88997.1 ornithine racemase [Tetragenococcus muriaticus 3MR10-3]
MVQYPKLVVDLEKLKHNVETIIKICEEKNIKVAGVIKGFNGSLPMVNTYRAGGIEAIGSSRIEQLKKVREMWPNAETLMLRIPMLSELDKIVKYTDISLQSELITLKELNKLCLKTNHHHRVILMVDLGDLREGFFKKEELFKVAMEVEKAKGLTLEGIGVNLGCYGSIEPDEENLGELCKLAKQIEQDIGRELAVVSGGATTSLQLVFNDKMPNKINNLRIGDGILLRDMENYFDYTLEEMNGDVFKLSAEIIEIKEKPTYPIGTISVDAFGNTPEYTDQGVRRRALLAVGRQDIGDMTKLYPYDEKIKIFGGSSDHTIIDLTDCSNNYKIGDIISFSLEYENVLYATGSPYVTKEYK